MIATLTSANFTRGRIFFSCVGAEKVKFSEIIFGFLHAKKPHLTGQTPKLLRIGFVSCDQIVGLAIIIVRYVLVIQIVMFG